MTYGKPRNWQDFELLVGRLLEKRYGILLAPFGRRGQNQHGADLMGTIPPAEKWNEDMRLLQLGPEAVGKTLFVQCKHRTALTLDEVVGDYNRAVAIDGIDTVAFLVATTLDTDVGVQIEIQGNLGRVPHFKGMLFWDDFEQMLDRYRDVAGDFGYYQRLSEEDVARIAGMPAMSLRFEEGFREQFARFEILQQETNRRMEQIRESQEKLKEMMESISRNVSRAADREAPETEPDPMIRMEYTAKTKGLLETYPRALFRGGIIDRFSKTAGERKFFLGKEYESFLIRFLNACSLSIEEKSPQIDDAGMDLVWIRALGIMAMAYLRRIDKNNTRKIRLEIEIDPTKIYPTPTETEQEIRDIVLEWARDYHDFEVRAYDRELLNLDAEMPFEELYTYMKERFGYPIVGMKRLVELTALKTEMLKQMIRTRKSDPALYWAILVGLGMLSFQEITSLRVPPLAREHGNVGL